MEDESQGEPNYQNPVDDNQRYNTAGDFVGNNQTELTAINSGTSRENNQKAKKQTSKDRFKANYLNHIGFKMPDKPEFIRQKELRTS